MQWLFLFPVGVVKRHVYTKPTASRETAQLWVRMRNGWFPEGGLAHLVRKTQRKEDKTSPPSGNIGAVMHAHHPQLRRFTACSGFRIEVPLRGTLCFIHNTIWLVYSLNIYHNTPKC